MPPSTPAPRDRSSRLTRVQKVQKEIVNRYDRIVNLWISFHNSGTYVDEFAREFYHAVGRILQGAQLNPQDLTIELHEVVNNRELLKLGGMGDTNRGKEKRQIRT